MTNQAYPNEGYLRDVIVRHFADIGCEEEAGPDLVCLSADSGVKWVIEIVGKSASPRSEFRIALANLLTRMEAGPDANYVLVTPDIPDYVSVREQVPGWAREVLNLSWFVVDRAGEINAIPPYGPIDAQRLREATARELER